MKNRWSKYNAQKFIWHLHVERKYYVGVPYANCLCKSNGFWSFPEWISSCNITLNVSLLKLLIIKVVKKKRLNKHAMQKKFRNQLFGKMTIFFILTLFYKINCLIFLKSQ